MTTEGTSATPLRPGDPPRLGEYELVGRLGEGGQGTVFLGRDAQGRRAAVKLLHARLSGDARARGRFIRELEVARRVSGFCTAQVLDADIAGDTPYFVSEYVPGPSLKEQVAAGGPLDAQSLVRLAIGTATALAAVHRAGIVHRDFKPGNVLMGPDGPRVIDFGIARALDSGAVTMTSQVVGTPAFMAPEQVAGGAIGPQADLFAWAATMLFAATGRAPFGDDSIPAVMHRILYAEPDLSALPPALTGIVAGCLAKDPARRPGSDAVLMGLLGQVGAAPRTGGPDLLARAATLATGTLPPVAPPPGPLPWPVKPAARPPMRWRVVLPLLAGAMTAVVAAGVTAFVVLNDRAGKGGSNAPASVQVAFLGATTGGFKALGGHMRDGAEVAVDQYNAGRPATRIELVDYDTAGEAGTALARARQLAADDRVVGVIGPLFSADASLAGPYLEANRVPMVSPGATGQEPAGGQGYLRLVVPPIKVSLTGLAQTMVREERPRHVVVVGDDQGWTRPFADHVALALQGRGVRVTRDIVIGWTDRDLRAEVERIKDADPDAVFYPGLFDAAARLIEQARAAGVRAPFYLSDASLTEQFVTDAGREQAEGTVLFCSCTDPAAHTTGPVRSFRDLFRSAFGREAGLYTVEGYDAALALVSAVKAGHTTREAIHRHLGTMNAAGLGQRLRFRPDGHLERAVVHVFQVRGGEIVQIGTSETARP
ncbi:bifunctional serine/threonine-protein kinase/ABC transporter substrate-binding protein [Thermomonospora cellulosilytica]|uniref:ABC-type branched-subunit amino acid transport system substrate-binding protein n=1 Tax=Thermomonospora cellulosilytica TaxID=1411118 RepID=A0A7W3N4L3_9ACTN|nr:bifunctional serine/threonine-protein kinase/ABC transporter substrate-binding protein [Thermomonospora cellulosilytica]MBA9007405.1 ABC-type branched-subunit amino acid transport system substrate-binding protein [Thermomonospora cellulosilytica]